LSSGVHGRVDPSGFRSRAEGGFGLHALLFTNLRVTKSAI
jgi:hypothetical protein